MLNNSQEGLTLSALFAFLLQYFSHKWLKYSSVFNNLRFTFLLSFGLQPHTLRAQGLMLDPAAWCSKQITICQNLLQEHHQQGQRSPKNFCTVYSTGDFAEPIDLIFCWAHNGGPICSGLRFDFSLIYHCTGPNVLFPLVLKPGSANNRKSYPLLCVQRSQQTPSDFFLVSFAGRKYLSFCQHCSEKFRTVGHLIASSSFLLCTPRQTFSYFFSAFRQRSFAH
jgi:hypothetical protein